MTCPDKVLQLRWHDRDLHPEQQREIARHVNECGKYRQRVDELELIGRALRATPPKQDSWGTQLQKVRLSPCTAPQRSRTCHHVPDIRLD